MHEISADISEAFLAMPSPPDDPAFAILEEIALAIIADSALGRTEQKQAIHAGLVPGGAQTLEGGTALVDPDRIAVDDEEGFAAQNRQSLDDAAASIEDTRLGLTGRLPRHDLINGIAEGGNTSSYEGELDALECAVGIKVGGEQLFFPDAK